MIKKFVTFFGAGLSPKAPGTMGTLAALPLVFVLMYFGSLIHMLVTLVLAGFAIWACEVYEREKGGHDHQEIVIDEVVGILITMVWMPITWQAFVVGFLLFRLLDILKPWPISVLDKKVSGGVGVMVDDITAGIVANLVLQWIYTNTNWLGAQLL